MRSPRGSWLGPAAPCPARPGRLFQPSRETRSQAQSRDWGGNKFATCRYGLQLTGVTQRAFIPLPSPALGSRTFAADRTGRLAATDSPALSGRALGPHDPRVGALRLPRRRPTRVVSFSNWLSDRSQVERYLAAHKVAIRNLCSRTPARFLIPNVLVKEPPAQEDQPQGNQDGAGDALCPRPQALADTSAKPDTDLRHDERLNADQDQDHQDGKLQQPDGEADCQLVDADADA